MNALDLLAILHRDDAWLAAWETHTNDAEDAPGMSWWRV